MRVRILGSAPPGADSAQYLTSYLVNDGIVVDGGSLGLHAMSPEVAGVRDVLLTHAHIDHVGTLPIFIETAVDPGDPPVRLYGVRATLDSLRRHVFNGSTWADAGAFMREGAPMIVLRELEPESVVVIGDLRITPVSVDHAVPTVGYVLDDGSTAVVLGADSGPTERLWEVARATGRLRAVFLECSFPDRLADLAARTGHLTPALWKDELRKLPDGTTAIAVHIKPRHRQRVVGELRALNPRIEIGVADRDYRW